MKVDPPLGDVEGHCHFTAPYVLTSAQARCQLSSKAAKAGRKKCGYSGHSASCPLIPQAKRLLNPRAFQMILQNFFLPSTLQQ